MERLSQSAINQRRSSSRDSEPEQSRPKDWSAFFAPDAPIASEEFMKGVEDLPPEERAFFAVPQERATRGTTRRRRPKSK